MEKMYAIIGAVFGGALGFMMRPENMLIGKLDFMTTLTRGSNLGGMDQILMGQAQTSSNMLIGGILIGLIIGLLVGKAVLKKSVK